MIDKIYLHLQLNYENSEEAEEAKKEVKKVFKDKTDLLAKMDLNYEDIMIKRQHYMVKVGIPYTNAGEKMEVLLGASKKKQKSAFGIYQELIDTFLDSVTPADGFELSFWWKVQFED